MTGSAPGTITLVAARAANGVIGAEGGIPWRIPADFAHFKQVTVGHPLVMGRATFDSIGRPLPGRQNIVVTRDRNWAHPGVLVGHCVQEALRIAADLDDEVCVGGGAAIYAAAMPWATHQILSEIRLSPAGDTYYPDFDEADWWETRRVDHTDEDPTWSIRWLTRIRDVEIPR